MKKLTFDIMVGDKLCRTMHMPIVIAGYLTYWKYIF